MANRTAFAAQSVLKLVKAVDALKPRSEGDADGKSWKLQVPGTATKRQLEAIFTKTINAVFSNIGECIKSTSP